MPTYTETEIADMAQKIEQVFKRFAPGELLSASRIYREIKAARGLIGDALRKLKRDGRIKWDGMDWEWVP